MLFLSGASLWLLWAVVIVIFLVIESMTVGLQAIWYAVGALAAQDRRCRHRHRLPAVYRSGTAFASPPS